MQIIIGKDNATALRERYTVLELETLEKDGVVIDAFCVVPAEKINLGEMVNLDKNIRLHEKFVESLKMQDYDSCRDLYGHLYGKFGGELNSFYDEIMRRADSMYDLGSG